jgi:hypothetical protein
LLAAGAAPSGDDVVGVDLFHCVFVDVFGCGVISITGVWNG